jgi:hypothetical protein
VKSCRIVKVGEERRGRWKRGEGIQKVEKEENAWRVRGKRGVCIKKLREELSNTLTQVAPLVSTVSLEAEGSMDECLGQILAMAAATQASI